MLWILVANSATARIYTLPSRTAKLVEQHRFTDAQARQHERDLVSDRSGRVHDRKGAARHAMEPEHTAREIHAEDFARHLDDFLHRSLEEKQYEELIVIASPRFLGRLRAHYGHWLSEPVLKHELAKDWTARNIADIRAELETVVPSVTGKASNAGSSR